MKIFGKTLKQYVYPIKYYIIISILIVISQYYVAGAIENESMLFLRITQWAWEIMVALSVITLVWNRNFNIKQITFVGVLYCFIIHGLKAFFFRTLLFPYSGTITDMFYKIMYKFLYGSLLVMAIALGIGIAVYYIKKDSARKR